MRLRSGNCAADASQNVPWASGEMVTLKNVLMLIRPSTTDYVAPAPDIDTAQQTKIPQNSIAWICCLAYISSQVRTDANSTGERSSM